jgi:CRP-like cAMP-binding protein
VDGIAAFLPDGVWDRLASSGTPREYPRGSVLMSQGERAETVLALVSGRVKVLRENGADEGFLLAVRGGGDLLGEIALLGDGTRSATVIAIDACRTRVFSMDGFTAFCAEHGLDGELARHLVRRMAEGEGIRAEFAALPGH